MKKRRTIVLLLLIVLLLAGCGKTSEDVLIITVNGERVSPYQYVVYSKRWRLDGGFLFADGVELDSFQLQDLAKNGQIPQIAYGEDLEAELDKNATIREITLYDNQFNRLDGLWELSDLSQLDAGEYYVAVRVNQLGDYIREAKEHEYVGKDCVFRLIVEK